jgi:hypothetical protein
LSAATIKPHAGRYHQRSRYSEPTNDHIPLASDAPHDGFKQSAFGKDLSAEAVGDYLVTKHVIIAR